MKTLFIIFTGAFLNGVRFQVLSKSIIVSIISTCLGERDCRAPHRVIADFLRVLVFCNNDVQRASRFLVKTVGDADRSGQVNEASWLEETWAHMAGASYPVGYVKSQRVKEALLQPEIKNTLSMAGLLCASFIWYGRILLRSANVVKADSDRQFPGTFLISGPG